MRDDDGGGCARCKKPGGSTGGGSKGGGGTSSSRGNGGSSSSRSGSRGTGGGGGGADFGTRRYIRTAGYGWFDRAHFVFQQVDIIRDAVYSGKAEVTVPSHLYFFKMEVTYALAPDLKPDQLEGIALAIFMDWSIRFEAWESDFLPVVALALGHNTTFANEDLPTHYLTYVSRVLGSTPTDVIDTYLGGVVASQDSEPPYRNALFCAGSGCIANPVAASYNIGFMPRVEVAPGRWQGVPWPAAITIPPVASGPSTWQFSSQTATFPGTVEFLQSLPRGATFTP